MVLFIKPYQYQITIKSISIAVVYSASRISIGDNGFQDWHTEYEIAALDVEYLVQHQGSRPMAVTNNALIRARGYTQRWMSETSYSTVKRTQDSVLRSRFWYRQFREIVLLFALNNIKKLAKTL